MDHTLQLGCPHCDSRLVGAEDVRELGGATFEVRMRCAECEKATTTRVGPDGRQALIAAARAGTRQIEHQLAALEQARMDDACAAFASALRDDLILPEDF